MIRKYCIEDICFLKKIIKEDLYQNVYLYIDASTYGFENHDVMTWILCREDRYIAIVFQYYNSLQLFEVEEPAADEIEEICKFVEKNNIEMIPGNIPIINRIFERCEQFVMTDGVIMKAGKGAAKSDTDIEWAEISDCREIAELICADEGIGGHYSIQLLQEQLEDRMRNWNCKNLILKKQGKIVSHMATYADVKDIAVLGGLVTAPEYRGYGYGKTILQGITDALIKEGKIPVLYCYDKQVTEWYAHIGWERVTTCAKLERRH